MTRKNARGLSNLRRVKNRMASKFLGMSLTNKEIYIKLDEII